MKKKKWMRRRHGLVKFLLILPLYFLVKLRYRVSLPRFRNQKGRQFLILMNHQTPFDQFFVALTFRKTVYYLATEDIFSMGWISSLIRFLVAPIPIRKQTADMAAVMNCLRVAKEGGTIALAPEGNRTYTGRTEYMNPAIAQLARKLGLPIALYRIEGGYGVQPRWADTIRRGKMRAYVSGVIEPEQVARLTDDELYRAICEGLFVDDTTLSGPFRHKRKAEHLERAIYVCPYCGLSHFESRGDILSCRSCGRRVRYTEQLTLVGEGFDFPFPTVAAWYDYQCEYVNSLDTTRHTDVPLYEDRVALSEVALYKSKRILCKRTAVRLYGDRIEVDRGDGEVLLLPFASLEGISALGRRKINVYFEKRVYQLKGDARFCGLKYVNLYYRFKNITQEVANGKFLGL